MMDGESSMAAMMMVGMAGMMDSDQIGAMVDMMGDPDPVSGMTAMMSMHQSEFAEMMSAPGSGMMSWDGPIGFGHGGLHSP